uniref:WW domain-binding protein 11 n=1 Tax=Eptatretus burgeri TaxID=7764 RepID=A0A8C4R3J7_EPTBU
MMVRTAVLKMKDPRQILKDMEKIDEMEFNPTHGPMLNEKVLRDKRKKLHETFERIMRLYEKENPEQVKDLRQQETEYGQRRAHLAQHYEAVKNAQHVEIDTIPLPDMPHAPSNITSIQDIPLPGAQPPSILKKSGSFGTTQVPVGPSLGVPKLPPSKRPPGPPPGPPPPQVLMTAKQHPAHTLPLRDEDEIYDPETAMEDIGEAIEPVDIDAEPSSSEDEDEKNQEIDEQPPGEGERPGRVVRFAEGEGGVKGKKKEGLTPLQAMMLRMAGQEIPTQDERDNEEEEEREEFKGGQAQPNKDANKGSKAESNEEGKATASNFQKPSGPLPHVPHQIPVASPAPSPSVVAPPQGPPPMAPPGIPPLRPPGPPSGPPPAPPPGVPPFLRPLGILGMRAPPPRLLPPGPPPGRPPGPPPGLPPGPPPRAPPPRLLPPGIPPPPRHGMLRPPGIAPPMVPLMFPPPGTNPPGVLSAPPSLISRPKGDEGKAGPGIGQTAQLGQSSVVSAAAAAAAVAQAGSMATIEKAAMATISAKPQITNPKADVTRFMPTSLRVKREAKGRMVPARRPEDETMGGTITAVSTPKPASKITASMPTKDDMYEAFMKEMEGLL